MAKLSPLRAALAATCALAMMAGPAHAQGRGIGLRALVNAAAVSSANRADVQQQGTANGAGIAQTGEGNAAGVYQFGRANTGTISQTGDNNSACLVQFGRNLNGSITQVGDNLHAGVMQTRHATLGLSREACAALSGNQPGSIRGIVQRNRH